MKGLTFLMPKICNQFRSVFFTSLWTAFSSLFSFIVIYYTILVYQEWELAENLQGVLEYQTRCCWILILYFFFFYIYNHSGWLKSVLVLCLTSQVRFKVFLSFKPDLYLLVSWLISNTGLDWLCFLLMNCLKLMILLGIQNSKVWRTLLYIFLITLVVILLRFILLVYVVKQHRFNLRFSFFYLNKWFYTGVSY